jgi:hypothetical protein
MRMHMKQGKICFKKKAKKKKKKDRIINDKKNNENWLKLVFTLSLSFCFSVAFSLCSLLS